MPEISPIDIAQIDPYIQTLASLSETLFLPFMLFIIYLSFVLHLSTIYPLSSTKIHSVISARKKSSMVILIFLRFYQQCFYYYFSSYITPEQLILCLISELIIQMALIASISFITVQNMKMISLPFKHLIGTMLFVIALDYICKIIIEVYYGVFMLLITLSPLSSCITLYLTVLFFRYPTNDHVRLLSSHIAYVELQEMLIFNSTTINLNKATSSKGGLISSNIKHLQPTTYMNKPIKDILNQNSNGNGNKGREALSRVINYIPTVKVEFKTSFHINYYKNERKEGIDRYSSDIVFDFTVTVIELHISNKVKRTLSDFVQLERSLTNEISEANFSKQLVDEVPALNLNISHVSNYSDLLSNSEAITTVKGNIEKFLKEIVSKPGLITHSILEFLDIFNNNELEDFYASYRKKYHITESIKLNSYNDLSRTLSHKPEQQISKAIYFSVIDSIPNKLFVKEYTLSIKVACENAYKIVKKNLSDTLVMLNEANQQVKDVKEIKDVVNKSDTMKRNDQWSSYDKFLNDPQTSMTEFIKALEGVLTYISAHYLQYRSNLVISEYYADFYSSFIFQSSPIRKMSSSNSIVSDSQDKFEALLNENLISYIDILAENFLFISIDFKIKVFYEIAFKIISKSQDLIVLNKKYLFKEVKHYINVMSTSLGLTSLITQPLHHSSHTKDLTLKSKERLSYLQKALNTITNHKFFLRVTYWKELIYLDIAFESIQKQGSAVRSSVSSSTLMSDSFYNGLN